MAEQHNASASTNIKISPLKRNQTEENFGLPQKRFLIETGAFPKVDHTVLGTYKDSSTNLTRQSSRLTSIIATKSHIESPQKRQRSLSP